MDDLVDRLNSEDVETRQDAIYELGETEDPKYLPYLINALEDPDLYVRVYAIQAMRDMAHTSVVADLCRLVQGDNCHPTIVSNVCAALGEIGSSEALPTLVRMLDSTIPFTRYGAATALGEIGDPAAIPALEKLYGDDTMPEREDDDGGCVETLYSVGEQAKRAAEMIQSKE